MEQRELAALASVKNPNQPRRQQSLVVTGRSTGQQLAWLNAGAVADANVFNHPVRFFVRSRVLVRSLVLKSRPFAGWPSVARVRACSRPDAATLL